jgi:hypothetical protein
MPILFIRNHTYILDDYNYCERISNCCKNPEKIKLEIKKLEKQISKREISKQQNPEKKYRNWKSRTLKCSFTFTLTLTLPPLPSHHSHPHPHSYAHPHPQFRSIGFSKFELFEFLIFRDFAFRDFFSSVVISRFIFSGFLHNTREITKWHTLLFLFKIFSGKINFSIVSILFSIAFEILYRRPHGMTHLLLLVFWKSLYICTD